jgi:hypothetical protein
VPLLEGLVVKVDGEEVIVNLGEETKLKKGMRMIVFEEGEPLRDPVTGRSLGSDLEERGKARIERVRARVSHAEVVERKEESAIKPMMKVITQ